MMRAAGLTPPCASVIGVEVALGDLYAARRVALHESFEQRPAEEPNIDSDYQSFRMELAIAEKGRGSECMRAWIVEVDKLLERPDALSLIDSTHRRRAPLIMSPPAAPPPPHLYCDVDVWEACCSSLLPPPTSKLETKRRERHCAPRPHWQSEECCFMGNGTRAHLKLPALQEIELALRLPTGRTLRLDQDGLLRKCEPLPLMTDD